MPSVRSTRRKFAAALGSLLSGCGIVGAASIATAETPPVTGVEKLNEEGKPAMGSPFIMPIVRHNDLICVAGQGAHDERPAAQWDISRPHSKSDGPGQESCGTRRQQHGFCSAIDGLSGQN